MSKREKPEKPQTPYASIPCSVMDSEAYCGSSPHAKELLMELARQHNGQNNGHLHLSLPYLAKRGIKSRGTVAKYRDELIVRKLIVKTKNGGRPVRRRDSVKFEGADQFALTWLPISNFSGLDITKSEHHIGIWNDKDIPKSKNRYPDALKAANNSRSKNSARCGPQYGSEKQFCSPAERDADVPSHGSQYPFGEPQHGTSNAENGHFGEPQHGKNVVASATGTDVQHDSCFYRPASARRAFAPTRKSAIPEAS